MPRVSPRYAEEHTPVRYFYVQVSQPGMDEALIPIPAESWDEARKSLEDLKMGDARSNPFLIEVTVTRALPLKFGDMLEGCENDELREKILEERALWDSLATEQ